MDMSPILPSESSFSSVDSTTVSGPFTAVLLLSADSLVALVVELGPLADGTYENPEK